MLPVAVLPLFHLCPVKTVLSIVVTVSRPSVPHVPPAGMIVATAEVAAMAVTVVAEAVVAIVVAIAVVAGNPAL